MSQKGFYFNGERKGNKCIISVWDEKKMVNGMQVFNEILPTKYCTEVRNEFGENEIFITSKDYKLCKRKNLIEYVYFKEDDLHRTYDIEKCLKTKRAHFLEN